jgi:hypothetical protein
MLLYVLPLLRSWAELIASQCSLDFVLILEASGYFNATNQLDYVYAFMGHSKARNPGYRPTILWMFGNNTDYWPAVYLRTR